MANLWDALVSGYNNPGGVPLTSDGGEAHVSTSAWDDLIASVPRGRTRPSASGSREVVDHDFVVSGLVDRGLPRHVAEGFAMNFADESGFDSGINEISPLVKGSRGGYGLYQLTGPRRRAYEAYAADRGVDVASADAQLDFLVHELETTEKSAARSILSAQTAGEAGAAVVNKFLRPAAEHRKKRAAKYLSGAPAPTPAKPTPTKLWLDF